MQLYEVFRRAGPDPTDYLSLELPLLSTLLTFPFQLPAPIDPA